MAVDGRMMGDGTEGPDDDAPEHEAERRCIVTRESGPRDGLIRFAVGPDGEVVPDLAERLPGRGLWLTARRDIVRAAVTRRAFGRAARRAVSVPEDLPDRLEALLARRCIEQLGLARRAGSAVFGHRACEEAVRAGNAAVLLTAAESVGRDARELAARMTREAHLRVLTGEELGAAFGRDHLVHVAVLKGRLADSLVRDIRRLAGFRDRLVADEGNGAD